MKPAKLINFNVPNEMRQRFDVVCHASGKTRTSVLIELMTHYVLNEGKRLIERQKEFGDFDRSFQESKGLRGSRNRMDADNLFTQSARQTWGEEGFELPSPIMSDGREDW